MTKQCELLKRLLDKPKHIVNYKHFQYLPLRVRLYLLSKVNGKYINITGYNGTRIDKNIIKKKITKRNNTINK